MTKLLIRAKDDETEKRKRSGGNLTLFQPQNVLQLSAVA
jgi:hypothetical protein